MENLISENFVNKTDSRYKLKENPFSYMVTKSLKMLIYFEGKWVMLINEAIPVSSDYDRSNQMLLL
ncbi:MAG: hypothetical protein SGI89_01790 [bacterium]|nr:hypothetical protein [bacterium]